MTAKEGSPASSDEDMTETDTIEPIRSINKNIGTRTGPLIPLKGGGIKKKLVAGKGAKWGAGEPPAPEEDGTKDTPMNHVFPASTSKTAGHVQCEILQHSARPALAKRENRTCHLPAFIITYILRECEVERHTKPRQCLAQTPLASHSTLVLL
jgi:hypothetical protein